jgi:pSer/pThr/pTyr-binding forkhead associated (FHA) protein
MEKTRVIVSNVYIVNASTKEETRVLGEMVFGRLDVDQNYPDDTLISRRHLRFVCADDVVLIEDLGSTNRTKVNGKLLKASTLYKLRSRDVIEFGQQKVQIFIGGKIAGDKTKVTKAPGEKKKEQSLVFDRFMADDLVGSGGKPNAMARSQQQASAEGIVRGVEGLEIQAEVDQTQKDDGILQNLVQKKNAAWYLQFGGSEFGPVSLRELKEVVKSKQFQGGELFAFTEGLADWLPVTKLQKFLDEPQPEFTATQRIGGGVPLGGTVTCTLRGAENKITGRIDAITLSDITVTLKDPLLSEGSLFEIEVAPEPNSGVEPFKATVKSDAARSLKNTHVLVFVQATPRTKMAIERFIRSKG